MSSVKMVLVKEEGVLGFILQETPYGADVCWYIDGLRHEASLEEGDYVITFIGEIDG